MQKKGKEILKPLLPKLKLNKFCPSQQDKGQENKMRESPTNGNAQGIRITFHCDKHNHPYI
jgi:hypothetical protein